MKKALVLLLALCTVAAFAQTPAVSGSATLTWGYNLETGATGFLNAYTANVTIPFAVADKTATGEGTYGYISLSGITFELKGDPTSGYAFNAANADGDKASLSAKIVSGAFYATVYSAPSLDFNKAAEIDTTEADDVKVLTASDTYGTKIGMTGDYAFGLILDSAGDWTTNTANNYAVGGTAALALLKDGDVTAVALNLAAGYELAANTFGVSIDAPLVFGTLKVTPAADLVYTTALTYDAKLTTSFGFDADSNTKVEAIAYYSDTDDDLELKVGFAEKEAAGLVDMLAFSAYFTAANVLNGMAPYNVAVSGSYKAMLDETFYLKPGFSATYYNTEQLKASVYVDAKLIANTVFTAKWAGDDVTGKVATDTTAGTINLGSITFAAKISL